MSSIIPLLQLATFIVFLIMVGLIIVYCFEMMKRTGNNNETRKDEENDDNDPIKKL